MDLKNKGVLVAILLILILGLGITFQIHTFVTENTDSVSVTTEQATASESREIPMEADTGVMPEVLLKEAASDLMAGAVRAAGAGSSQRTTVSEAGAGNAGDYPETAETVSQESARAAAESMPKEAGTGNSGDTEEAAMDSAEAAVSQSVSSEDLAAYDETASDKQESTEEEETVSAGPSVLKKDGPGAENYLVEETVTYEDFRKKLEEADSIMEEMRESNLSSNTDSLKMTVEYEYRLWDTELNRLYQAVMGLMSEKEAELLKTEERQWIRDRDQMAKQAASKFKGGTMESLEYTASLANSTRERAYEILEEYGHLLPQE